MLSMSFVAHQDDDLLFMNPDIASDPQGGDEAWVVYLTAGNLTPGPDGMPYADGRIKGARAAWARALKMPLSSPWTFELITVGGRQLATNVLTSPTGGRVRLVFTFINAANGPDDGDLARMWSNAAFVASPIDGRPSYTRGQFVAMLKALIAYASPAFIRTQDPLGALQCGDHIDHAHAARFALSANLDTLGRCVRQADGYFGYIIQAFLANWSGYWLDEKQAIWNAYKPFDPEIGPTSWDNVMNRQFRRFSLQPGDVWSAADL